jgi:uncharacterized protein
VFATAGLLGVFIPGLPTTPFVLLAAWAASRGSERLHDWLLNHPRLGPPLADWNEQRAISSRNKQLALAFLLLSWALLFWRGTNHWVLGLLAALFIMVGTFVVTRRGPHH